MKRLLMFSVMAFMAIATLQAVAQRHSRQQAEQEIRRLEQGAVDAAINMDSKFYDRLLAPDWTGIDPLGRLSDKAELLREMKLAAARKGSTTISISMSDVSVRFVNDDVALLICRLRTSAAGRAFTTRATEVYVWRDGRWMISASQNTVLKGM